MVDASVLVKLVLNEPDSPLAVHLLSQMARSEAIGAAPDFIFVECANVFWLAVRRGRLSASDARVGLSALHALPLTVTPAATLDSSALDLALAHGISVYDGLYVALAQHLSLPLVTADATLATRLVASPISTLLLGNVASP